MSKDKLANLSVLQKRLLKAGLMAHWREEADNVFHVRDPGCFAVTTMMKEIADRKARATRRAAAGRALASLIKRGLLESCSRGAWRLTPRGVKVTKQLYPEIQRPSDHEPAVAMASWMDERPVLVRGRRPRGSKKMMMMMMSTTTNPKAAADPEPVEGIEVEMDY